MRRLGFCLALAGMLFGACTPVATSPKPGWTYAPGVGAASAPPASTAPGSGGGAVLGSIDVDAVDLAFEPTLVEVDSAGRYTVNLHNSGAITHVRRGSHRLNR